MLTELPSVRGKKISEHVSCSFFRKRSWLVCLCLSGCAFLTDRGVVKEGLFHFLLHLPFFFLLIFLFLCSTAVFHVAVKMSVLVSGVNMF